MNITIELNILEVSKVQSFILNKQLWFFGRNLPKKSRKMPQCEILLGLVYEILVCVTCHTWSEYFEQKKNIESVEIIEKKLPDCAYFKSRKLRNCFSSTTFLHHFSEITGNLEQKNIRLFLAAKGHFSCLFFFWISRRKREFARD